MPKITITEKTLNQNVNTLGTDIPYIPGFAGYTLSNTLSNPGSEPTLYTNIAEFRRSVGYTPYTYTEGDKTVADKSYIMASELLLQGMPIYYHVPMASNTINLIKDDSIYFDNNVLVKTSNGITLTFSDSDKTCSASFKSAIKLETDDKIETIIPKEYEDILSVSVNTTTRPLDMESDISITFTATEAGTYKLNQFGIIVKTDGTPALTKDNFTTSLLEYLNKKDLADKGEYTIKYITSGGYANIQTDSDAIYKAMKAIAEQRQDCIAIAENICYDQATSDYKTIYDYLNDPTKVDLQSEYSTGFDSWASYITEGTYANTKSHILPACFGYLLCLAKSIKTNPNWLAIAGVGRGYISNLEFLRSKVRLSNTLADSYQPTGDEDGSKGIAINAITNIKPYGYTIWGNRTLKIVEEGKGLTPTHFLSTRNMISDIKKVCYSAAKALMFEQNSELLWLDFKGRITPYLERLSAGNGISGYSILKSNVKSDNTPVSSEEIACIIRIYPIRAVEGFDIMVAISDSDVMVEE